MKTTNFWLTGLTAVILFGASHSAFSQSEAQNDSFQIKGLPASDVLGSEDIGTTRPSWEESSTADLPPRASIETKLGRWIAPIIDFS